MNAVASTPINPIRANRRPDRIAPDIAALLS
jgi:hypothetical protein